MMETKPASWSCLMGSLGRRFITLWWLKSLLSPVLMFGFFRLYFYLLENPAYPVTTVPSYPLDGLIGFSPGFFWVYASLWAYVFLPLAFSCTLGEMRSLALGLGGICITGLGIFYRWPTQIDVTGFIPAGLEDSAYGMLKSLDGTGNSLPSLHVATAAYCALWLHDLFKRMSAPAALQLCNLLWCALIVYSTLAIKQHVFLDVVGGLALAAVFRLIPLANGSR